MYCIVTFPLQFGLLMTQQVFMPNDFMMQWMAWAQMILNSSGSLYRDQRYDFNRHKQLQEHNIKFTLFLSVILFNVWIIENDHTYVNMNTCKRVYKLPHCYFSWQQFCLIETSLFIIAILFWFCLMFSAVNLSKAFWTSPSQYQMFV